MKTAMITGITGQDGSYLAEFLLEKGYEVHGLIRRASAFNTDRIDHLYRDPHESDVRLFLHYGDLTDPLSLKKVIEDSRAEEIYHLGAQSHVRVSFAQPLYTATAGALGTLNLLEAAREASLRNGRTLRIYNAGSSEMFGSSPPPQSERTPFHPRSPYSASKVAAHWYAVNYREAYGLFIANGILFNHESPRRGETFLTRKVTRAATRIKMGLQNALHLGNLDARRDWGFAGDYVEAMWRMLQAEEPDDFAVATGTSHSVREFVEVVFDRLGLDWEAHVRLDERYLRPAEVEHLEGDASKAREVLGWAPKVSFHELVDMMIAHDMELARQEKLLEEHGHIVPQRGIASG